MINNSTNINKTDNHLLPQVIEHKKGWCNNYPAGLECTIIIILLASSVQYRGFEPRTGQTKDYKIDICCFFSTHTTLRRKSKDRLARNQDSVSQWINMSIHRLVSVSQHYKNPTMLVDLVQNKHHYITAFNLFSSYFWEKKRLIWR